MRQNVVDIIISGGWLMLPLLLSSVLATAIILERSWTLRRSNIAPESTLMAVRDWIQHDRLSYDGIQQLKEDSPLGEILAVAISNAKNSREIMKEAIEEKASKVVHDLEHFLNTLGTISVITPLLGLLGTVIGMIDVFTVIMTEGTGDTSVLAGGISKALITTAAGLTIAIPALVFHRHFQRRIDSLTVTIEQETLRLIEHLQKIKEETSQKLRSHEL